MPGPLIEYLITGSVAMLWLHPIISKQNLEVVNEINLLILPLAYVAGMCMDVVAYWLTKYFKYRIRERAERKYLGTPRVAYPGYRKAMYIEVITRFPELAKEIETRSGRDRIARGMLVNSVLLFSMSYPDFNWYYLGLLALSVPMWVLFEYDSHGFIISAMKVVEKQAAENKTDPKTIQKPVK